MAEGLDRLYAFLGGHVDYLQQFPEQRTLWIIVGTVLWILTVISYCPQTINLVKTRTSYGLAPMTVFCQSTCLFFLTFNVICLKAEDFSGLFQYQNNLVYARFLTFLNVFCQWIFYFPTTILLYIFFDKEVRASRDDKKVESERAFFKKIPIISVSLYIVAFMIFIIVGCTAGFSSYAMEMVGKVSGIIAFILEVLQFTPQFIATIKLRDNGSLSLAMLVIQAPVNVCNGIYMLVAQGDHWTTWSAACLDGIQEFLLLGVCIYFKLIRKRTDVHLLEDIDNKEIPHSSSEEVGKAAEKPSDAPSAANVIFIDHEYNKQAAEEDNNQTEFA